MLRGPPASSLLRRLAEGVGEQGLADVLPHLGQDELARQVGSAFGRIHHELIVPLVHRVLFILRERGLVDLPVVDGRTIRIVPESPLARAQNQDDIVVIDRYLEQIAGRFGPAVLNLLVDQEKTAEMLAAKWGVPAELIRSRLERQQLADALQQAAMAAAGNATQPNLPQGAGPLLPRG